MSTASFTTTLAERLRHETHELHMRAERAGVMADLIEGRIELRAYCTLLRNLYVIYATFEDALDETALDPELWALFRRLRRAPALANDLDALHRGDWRGELVVANATEAYASRLRELTRAQSVALVGHGYVRYLGDLHGGQILMDVVRKRFGLEGGEGTRFYGFGEASEVRELRGRFRSALGSLAISATDGDRIVEEARWAFVQHCLLFDEVKARYAVSS